MLKEREEGKHFSKMTIRRRFRRRNSLKDFMEVVYQGTRRRFSKDFKILEQFKTLDNAEESKNVPFCHQNIRIELISMLPCGFMCRLHACLHVCMLIVLIVDINLFSFRIYLNVNVIQLLILMIYGIVIKFQCHLEYPTVSELW